MIASVRDKFVFLANAKTGSTAVEAAFAPFCGVKLINPPGLKHINYGQLRQMFGDYFERHGCEVYAVVRDPIETLASWYRYRARGALADPAHAQHEHYTGDITFERFVREWGQENPPRRARVGASISWAVDRNGQPYPITLFSHDRLDALYERLCEHTGKRPELKTTNASPSVRLDFDRDCLLRVARLRREYELYHSLTLV